MDDRELTSPWNTACAVNERDDHGSFCSLVSVRPVPCLLCTPRAIMGHQHSTAVFEAIDTVRGKCVLKSLVDVGVSELSLSLSRSICLDGESTSRENKVPLTFSNLCVCVGRDSSTDRVKHSYGRI